MFVKKQVNPSGKISAGVLVTLLTIVALAAVLAASTASAANPPAVNKTTLVMKGWVTKASKPWRVALFLATPLNTYIQGQIDGAKQAAASLGVKLTVVTANWDPQQQLTQIQNAVDTKKYDGIVVVPLDPNVLCEVSRTDAAKAGIKVVVSNFPICGDIGYTKGTAGISTGQSLPFYKAYAQKAFKMLGAKGGKVAVVTGNAPLIQTIKLREAVTAVAKSNQNIKVVQIVSKTFDPAGGIAGAQAILAAHPDVNLIITSYDAITLGVTQEFQARGIKPGQIKLVSIGGDTTGVKLMKDGWVQGIASLPPVEEVGQAVEMLVADLDGLKHPLYSNPAVPATSKAYVRMITPANVGSYTPEW